jgi:hypothetical protein
LYVTLVPPLLLAAWGLGEILFVGGASRLSSDFDREWWSRAGAWTSMFGAAWLALFGVALYGPLAFAKLREAAFGMSAYTTLLVLAALVARLAMNREAPVATESRPTWQALLADRALDIAAFLALLAIVVGIAWLVDRSLPLVAVATTWIGLAAPSLELDYSLVDVVLLIVVLGIVVGVAGLCVNVNRFSLHGMYRDRLIRTFLGASRADYPAPPWPLDDTREYRESRQFEARDASRSSPSARRRCSSSMPRSTSPRAAILRGRSASRRRSRSRRSSSEIRGSGTGAATNTDRMAAASRSERRWRSRARRSRRMPVRSPRPCARFC